MNLTDLIRELEAQLKTAEKFTKEYDAQATALRNKLASVAHVLGQRLAGGGEAATKSKPATPAKKSSGGMSAAGRARIIEAQRKRWAAHRASLAGKNNKKAKTATPAKKSSGGISAAGRARIIEAQRKRWAAHRASLGKNNKKAAAAPKKKGRAKLSAAGRAKIIAAQRKRWAAVRRKK